MRYDVDTNLRSNELIASLLADPQLWSLENLVSAPRGNDVNNSQPRFGFAWDTRSDARIVVRGGLRPVFRPQPPVVGGRTRVGVFLEAHNLRNTVNYLNPSGVITSDSFGIRALAQDARQVQWRGPERRHGDRRRGVRGSAMGRLSRAARAFARVFDSRRA